MRTAKDIFQKVAERRQREKFLQLPHTSRRSEIEEYELKNIDIRLAIWQLCFERTNNSLYAWEALRAVIRLNSPLPQWVSEYLRDAANELLSTESDNNGNHKSRICAAESDNNGNHKSRICAALKLNPSGQGHVFDRYKKDFCRVRALIKVLEIKADSEKRGLPVYKNLEDIFASVAPEFGLTPSALRNTWRAYRQDQKPE